MLADRIGMAASRLLAAAAACVILFSFAAEDRKSYWSGYIQAAILICQQIFAILALVIFLAKILLKSASKSSFFCFGVEIRFWSCNFRRCCVFCVLHLLCFATRSLESVFHSGLGTSYRTLDKKPRWRCVAKDTT